MIDQSQAAPSSSTSSSHLMHHHSNNYPSYTNPSASSSNHSNMGHPNASTGQTSAVQRMDPFNQIPSELYGSASSTSIAASTRQPSSQSQPSQQFRQMPADLGASTSTMHSVAPIDIYDNYGNASTSDLRRSSVRGDPRRKEIYAYNAPFTLFSHGWSAATDPSRKFRLAVSSFIEEYSNKIHIVQLDEEAGELVHRSTFDHPYPATKIMWIPDQKGTFPDLLATSGDYLRLWRIGTDNNACIESLLNTNRTAEYCAPLTSFDWNELDMNLIGTSSIDTTCTVWQLETGQAIGTTRPTAAIDGTVRTQLIAHDKEVFDISFSRGSAQIFASVGADGSLRLFDLRRLEHSTIMYEDPQRQPLLRLAWNRNDHNYIATFGQDSKEVLILDLRLPCTPVARLRNHEATINGLSWAPHSGSHICTAGDDYQALIWDVHEMPKPINDPILAYRAQAEVNQIHWSSSFPDWISICSDNKLEILRV
ncbi:WD_REPEATS_REGION domain-containing protein [Caenorhabditis elegans]|uniref:WD_REPEATS_REGION domain-containing protein n=1 Tax=Caenorhabditis elegans TaxID=6239 RepID=Q93759_CAEEL|nr:WD_REPEATS_REGION domain-containing protein [Caenorhabditis elegans]CAB02116.2 WD_REPEATS_REGION domain-containing protein [Caenorhabditis elegans]|eukprot:NP_506417.1 Seven WD repeats, AN11 family [Caenorhabditis elegans]